VGRSIFKTQGLHIDQLSPQDLLTRSHLVSKRSWSSLAPWLQLAKDDCRITGAEKGREKPAL